MYDMSLEIDAMMQDTDDVNYDHSTCECGQPIEKIALGYYLHRIEGRFFTTVKKTSPITNCINPKPKKINKGGDQPA